MLRVPRHQVRRIAGNAHRIRVLAPTARTVDVTGDAVGTGTGSAQSDNAGLPPGGNVATKSGTYQWEASYSGDVNNDAAKGACNDPGEDVIVKTKPMKQWELKRELLRRIKRRFEQLDIEIPYPHRTVVHRKDAATDSGRLVA